MSDKLILFVYAVFLMLGGYFGYKKGSKASLYMGVLSGFLILAGATLLDSMPGAWIFLAAVNCGLTLVFLKRYMSTRAFMPSGMLLLVALAMLFFCLYHLA